MAPPLARLEVLHFRHPLARPIPSVMGPLRNRPALLLRIEDAEGAFGWGEIWCNFPPDGDLHRARLAANVLGGALAGMDADATDPSECIRAKLHRLALQSGEPGPVSQVAAGADIALHDLCARRAGRPLAELIGGSAGAVPAYASGISPESWEPQIERMRGLGYRRFKQRIGFGPGDSIDVAERVAADLAADEALMLDANQAWNLAAALKNAARLEAIAPVWLEEPLAVDAGADDWSALASATDIPLAGGENMMLRDHFDRAIDGKALRFLQPDACKWGGVSGVLSIARAAEAAGVTYCPHFLGGGVGLLAAAHVLSAVGGAGLLEVDSSENPLLEIFSGGLRLSDGMFSLPPGAGLGPEPDFRAAGDMLVSRAEVAL
jgi:L-alanine-DL-glutamate epimerase-like enolase superfamily enzyme